MMDGYSWPNFATTHLGCNRTPSSRSLAKSCAYQARVISNFLYVTIVSVLSNKKYIYSTNTLPKLHVIGSKSSMGTWDDMEPTPENGNTVNTQAKTEGDGKNKDCICVGNEMHGAVRARGVT